MYQELHDTLDRIAQDAPPPSAERLDRLKTIAEWIKERNEEGGPVDLVFICVHNSRRSVMAQAWAAAAARYHGLEELGSWSAGAERTAIAPPAINALWEAGFWIEDAAHVPEARVPGAEFFMRTDKGEPPMALYSKTVDELAGPKDGFAAIMVCDEGEKACPFVAKAGKRFALPYLDPKVSDGTPDQDHVYQERSEEIARDMLFLMDLAKQADR